MQENEVKEISDISVEELFAAQQESYQQAQQRAAEENKSFAKTEFFKMDKFGTYRLRVLPIAPSRDNTASRMGYEYPVRQLLMELIKPGGGTKPTYMYLTAPRAIDAGYSVDLIDTYRKEAVSQAGQDGDGKLAEKIAGGSFGGGLKYAYGHAIYVLDANNRAKGVMLLTLSHSQFKELDDRKFKLWQKKLVKNASFPCPISSVYNAYPVEIEKKKNGSKTEYIIDIDNESDSDILSSEELTKLINSPRIPEIIHRYSRYILEATVVYLKQCDDKYQMKIMESDAMKEALETLSSELPQEDKSSFSFDKRSKDSKAETENGSGIMSLDDLFNRYEKLQEEGKGDKTEEGQELRGMIRTYIEQEGLSIRMNRTTSNKSLLDMVDEALGKQPDNPVDEEQAPPPPESIVEQKTQRNRRR